MWDMLTTLFCDCDVCSSLNDRRATQRHYSNDGERNMSDESFASTNRVQEVVDIEQNIPRYAVVPQQGTPLPMCPTNIDHTTLRGKAMLLKAGSPGEIEMPADGTLKMVVTHFLVMPDSQIDEKTGEVKEFARCCFFNAAGKHYRTTAAHGPYRLKAMLDLFGPEQWQAGIPIVVSVRKSKRGTTYHDIQIDTDAL